MADWSNEIHFDEFTDDDGVDKAQNDPWAVSSDTAHIPKLLEVPNDPLSEKISSEKYLESLERKLFRLKGRKDKESKASEMIFSLQKTKEDQLNQILAGRNCIADFEDEIDYQENTVVSSLQRRLNPERQALNPVELYPLLHNDFLDKLNEAASDDNKSDTGKSESDTNKEDKGT